jgi:hypothetical protein
LTYIKVPAANTIYAFYMAIDLEAEERRLELLERFRVQRAILVEQINEVTKFLNNVDKRIGELERQRWGVLIALPGPVPGLDAPTPVARPLEGNQADNVSLKISSSLSATCADEQ